MRRAYQIGSTMGRVKVKVDKKRTVFLKAVR